MKTRWKAGLRWLTTCMLTTDCILPQPPLFFPTAAKLCLGWADQRLCRLLNQFQLGFHINWPVSSDIDQHKLWLPEFIQQITMNLYIFNKYFKHLNWWSAAVLSPEPISAWFWFFLNWPVTPTNIRYSLQSLFNKLHLQRIILNISEHLNWWPAAVLSTEPISVWFWYKLTSDTDLKSVFNKLQSWI